MLSILIAAGWPVVPLLLCSVIALALIIERFLSLRESRVAPARLVDEVMTVTRSSLPPADTVNKLADNSVLGLVLAQGLRAVTAEPRMQEAHLRAAFESAGRDAVHRMERNLSALGTIASAAPLLNIAQLSPIGVSFVVPETQLQPLLAACVLPFFVDLGSVPGQVALLMASLPTLLPKEKMVAVGALNSISVRIGTAVSPGIAGLVIYAVGVSWTYTAATVLSAITVLLLCLQLKEVALGATLVLGFSVGLALVMGCAADKPVKVDDTAFIATSFPDFIPMMRSLGAEFS